MLVKEQQRTCDETETVDDDAVEEVTHTTKQGQNEASRIADVLAERDAEEHALHQRDLRAAAHASVMEDWTEHGTERPPKIRFELWVDPFSQAEPANEAERRFLKTRRIRERTLSLTRGDDS